MPFHLLHNQNIPYLLAPNLKGHSGMLHAFTTRMGGISKANFSSLNLGLHVGDNPLDVLENRNRVAKLFGKDLSSTVAVRQVHGIKIQKVTAQDKGQGALTFDDGVPEADALVTDEPGILLWCFFADCVPVLFYDPLKKVIASTHAGWKGTHLKIASETARVMMADYGCRPENILAAIGPSAGGCCYEVGADVADVFNLAKFENVIVASDTKFKLDLWTANKQALMESGIPENNISIAKLCTSCLTDMFFSYRGEAGKTGRFAAAIMLKE